MIPALASLPAAPRRIILHWTAGEHRANSVDLAAYHYLVEGNGTVRPGKYPIAANMRQVAGQNYARHTGGFNSFSIGLSLCGMRDADSRILPAQTDVMLRLAARMCLDYGLRPLDPTHLFTHAEAWRLHGVKGEKNDQKTDILHLPWNRAVGEREAGPWLRCRAYGFFAELVAAR